MSVEQRPARGRRCRMPAPDSDSDEIVMLDDSPEEARGDTLRKKGSGQKSRKRKVDPEPTIKTKTEEEDILAGFDLEGLPEEEIADLKRAIAASKTEERIAQQAEFDRLEISTLSQGDTNTDTKPGDNEETSPKLRDSEKKRRKPVASKSAGVEEPVHEKHSSPDRMEHGEPETREEFEPVKQERAELTRSSRKRLGLSRKRVDMQMSEESTVVGPGSHVTDSNVSANVDQEKLMALNVDSGSKTESEVIPEAMSPAVVPQTLDDETQPPESPDSDSESAIISRIANTDTMEYDLNLTVSEEEPLDAADHHQNIAGETADHDQNTVGETSDHHQNNAGETADHDQNNAGETADHDQNNAGETADHHQNNAGKTADHHQNNVREIADHNQNKAGETGDRNDKIPPADAAASGSLGFDPSQASQDNSQRSDPATQSPPNKASRPSRLVKEAPGSHESVKSQASGSRGSVKSQAAGSQESMKSQGSECRGSVIRQASTPQGSVKCPATGSQGLVDSPASGSQTEQAFDDTYIPLQRHYRNVAQRGQIRPYFCTDRMDVEKSTKAILQLFEIFSRKLRESQRKCNERAEWGDPVKSGQHQAKTIDIKRRGKESVYVSLSDEDDDDFEDTVKDNKLHTAERPTEEAGDLPELGGRVLRSRNEKDANDEMYYAETQQYDADLDEENTNQSHTAKEFRVKGARAVKNKAKAVCQSNNVHTLRKRGRPKAVTTPTVVVEDTQVDDTGDFVTITKQRRTKHDVCIEETQESDEDFDWLHVNTINEGNESEFDNPMLKSTIQEYTSQKKPNEKHPMLPNSCSAVSTQGAKAKPGVEINIEVELNNTKEIKQKNKPVGFKKGTQGIEDSGNSSRFRGRMRKKRTSFMLSSDSEDDIVADTQIRNVSADNTSEEKAKDTNKSGLTAAVGTFCSKIRNYFSPNSQQGGKDSHKSSEVEQEDLESQSPIIKKSRRLYNEHMDKFDGNDGNIKKNIVNAGPSVNLKNSNGQEELNVNPSGNLENEQKKGVKRLFSRPRSNESNVSDVSIATSQGSSTLLDDNGDLFPTQVCERRNKHASGHGTRQRTKHETSTHSSVPAVQRNANIDKTVGKINTFDAGDNSDEDCLIVGEAKKNYAKSKNQNSKLMQKQKGRNIRHVEGNIDKFFKPINKDVSDVSAINRDPELDSSRQEIPLNEMDLMDTHHMTAELGMNDEDTDITKKPDCDIDENPLAGMAEHSERNNETSKTSEDKKSDTDMKPVVRVPLVKIPDVNHDEELKASILEASSIHSSPSSARKQPLHDVQQRRGLPRGKNSPKEKSASATSTGLGSELPAVLSDQTEHHVDSHITTSQVFARARPKLPRRRKVSETISSADLEDGGIQNATRGSNRRHGQFHVKDHDHFGQHPTDHAALLGGRVTRKRRQLDLEVDDGQPVFKSQKTLKMVACPLCNLHFPASIIELHAANCLGPEPGDMEHAAAHHHHIHELEDSGEEDEGMLPAGVMAAHRCPHGHMDHIQHDAELHHLHDLEEHHAHLHHQHALEHLDDEDLDVEEEELQHLMSQHSSGPVNIEDKDVQNVVKEMRISPGEFGEIRQCYVCDKNIPKNLLERHIAMCMMIAKQQQAEVDEKGFDSVYNQLEEEPPIRTTRGRRALPEVAIPGPSTRGATAKQEPVKTEPTVKTEPPLKKETPVKMEPGNDGYKSVPIESKEEAVSDYISSCDDTDSNQSTSSDDNITLASLAQGQTGPPSAALITGPWNQSGENKQTGTTNNSIMVPDWMKNRSNSPIKSFVLTSQQEDSEYFSKQFGYAKDRVQKQMSKRKRSQGQPKRRRRKRRKVSRKK